MICSSVRTRTRREHQDRVVPKAPLLQRPSDVAHRLVHGGHHAGVQPALGVFDETVGGQVALGHLQGTVDGLQRHVEEERLRDGRERHVKTRPTVGMRRHIRQTG